MKVMFASYTGFAKHFYRVVGKIITVWGSIGNKIGVFIDSSYTGVSIIALAFTPRRLKNLLFDSIVKCSNYSYHVNTSKLITVMIDANHRLAYPLGQKLEGSIDGTWFEAGNRGTN